jgi:hypothetical protein
MNSRIIRLDATMGVHGAAVSAGVPNLQMLISGHFPLYLPTGAKYLNMRISENTLSACVVC